MNDKEKLEAIKKVLDGDPFGDATDLMTLYGFGAFNTDGCLREGAVKDFEEALYKIHKIMLDA